MVLSIDSFALKVIRKAEEKAFSYKAKIINITIPEKIKKFIEENLSKEVNFFKKKYKLEFNLIADKNLILPEYKIDLLNKNKKIIKKIDSFEKVENISFINNYKHKRFFNNKFAKRNKRKKNNFYNIKSTRY